MHLVYDQDLSYWGLITSAPAILRGYQKAPICFLVGFRGFEEWVEGTWAGSSE